MNSKLINNIEKILEDQGFNVMPHYPQVWENDKEFILKTAIRETINGLKKSIKPKLQTLCESAWDDDDEMIDFLFEDFALSQDSVQEKDK